MFTGFSQEAIDFLSDLKACNNEAFFTANKDRYERTLKQPMRALCEELTPVIQMVDPRLDVRPGRTMSRIRRDTRFSKDKSPFRDHVWLGWRYPGETRSEGFGMYWGFGIDWHVWGCGSYMPDKPTMDALRRAIRTTPEEVREIFLDPELVGRFALYGEEYKKLAVPEDVPAELRGLYIKKQIGFEHAEHIDNRELLFTHEIADRLAKDLLILAPVQRYMQKMKASANQTLLEEKAEKEEALKLEGKQSAAMKPRNGLSVRSEDEFEF